MVGANILLLDSLDCHGSQCCSSSPGLKQLGRCDPPECSPCALTHEPAEETASGGEDIVDFDVVESASATALEPMTFN
jgi:hypothetical protein